MRFIFFIQKSDRFIKNFIFFPSESICILYHWRTKWIIVSKKKPHFITSYCRRNFYFSASALALHDKINPERFRFLWTIGSLRFRLCQGSGFVRKFENRHENRRHVQNLNTDLAWTSFRETCSIEWLTWHRTCTQKSLFIEFPNYRRRISEIKRRKLAVFRSHYEFDARHANCASSSRT